MSVIGKLDKINEFSDILLVPYALGQEVSFIENKGPLLSKFDMDKFLNNTEKNFVKKLNPIYESIKETRKKLSKDKSLISFVGAPWTLIVYMLRLKEGKNKINLSRFNRERSNINNIIIEFTCIILVTLLIASRVRPQAMTKLIYHYRYNAGRSQY